MGEGEGGMIWENGIEICITSDMKWVASLSSMHDTGCLGLVHWDDPEGWYGEGGGFRMGNTCILIKCKKKKKQTLTLFQSSWRWSFSHVCSYNKFYKIDIYFNYNPEYPRSINMLCVQVFLAFVGTQNILSLYFFTG